MDAFPRDDETSRLLRESTAHMDAGNWDAAIECMERVKQHLIVSELSYPVETWCKLPLYLSRAGRFAEAMTEFDWLLSDLPRRARKESFMDDPSVSFGKRTSKKIIYNAIVRNTKRVVKQKREVAVRRQNRAIEAVKAVTA